MVISNVSDFVAYATLICLGKCYFAIKPADKNIERMQL